MKRLIESLIKEYVKNYEKFTETKWGEPIVGFSDAEDKMFVKLKDIIAPSHKLPIDFLQDAKTVISYFIPFEKYIVNSNIVEETSSREWALAYVETNKMIMSLNDYVKIQLEKHRFVSVGIPLSCNFDYKKLINDWSHRHAAYIAGLGSFGLNNMLITEKGCCGRVGTIVTNLKVEDTNKTRKEYCLYKRKGACKKCVENCVADALKIGSFDREKCYQMCLNNDKKYSNMGESDVCGKCLVGIPCSFIAPVKD